MTTPDIEKLRPDIETIYRFLRWAKDTNGHAVHHTCNCLCDRAEAAFAELLADYERLLRERPQIRLVGTQVKAAVNECSDMHGIGPDFPVTWLDTSMDFNALAKALNERLQPPAVSDPTIEDGFGNVWSERCPECEELTMRVVRPGKVQCDNPRGCPPTVNEEGK